MSRKRHEVGVTNPGRMQQGLRSPTVVTALAWVAVAASAVLGVVLRLIDPLSSSVIPAEDPYTHMAYVREHLRTGTLDPLNPPGSMYPPGLHALLAAVWVFTGAELYEIIRLGPVFFGAVGIIGMGLLLWRFAGPVAAAVGSLAYAIAPEIVFRSSMMAPTALDLALLPFLFYALLILVGGSLRWLAVTLPLVVFFVFTHPWLFGLLGVAAIVFVVASIFLPWRTRNSPRPTAFGLSLVLAMLVGGFGLSLTGCGGYCGPGFREILPDFALAAWFAPIVLVSAILPALLLARAPGIVNRLAPGPERRGLPTWAGLIVAAGIAVTFALFTSPAIAAGLPEQVEPARQLGTPILQLGFFGLIAFPLIRGRLAALGAALVVPTYPMVMYNLLDSPFWPHRTVVFLGVALVILVGVAAEAIVRWSIAAVRIAARFATRRAKEGPEPRASRLAVVGVAVLATGMLFGGVYANTPEIYPSGWYRLYPECELNALDEFAGRIDQEPRALVLVGDWRGRVVLGALAENPQRIWLTDAFYTDQNYREELLIVQSKEYSAIYVVMDRHAAVNYRHADTGFLDQAPFAHVKSWCAGMGMPEPRLIIYRMEGTGL